MKICWKIILWKQLCKRFFLKCSLCRNFLSIWNLNLLQNLAIDIFLQLNDFFEKNRRFFSEMSFFRNLLSIWKISYEKSFLWHWFQDFFWILWNIFFAEKLVLGKLFAEGSLGVWGSQLFVQVSHQQSHHYRVSIYLTIIIET